LVIVFFLGTRGDYPVAALVTQDAALPSQEVSGVALHLQIVERPPAAQTMDVLHGGAGGDFRSLLGLSALTETHRVVFYNQRGAGLSKRVTAENLTLDGYLEELDGAIDMTSFGQPVVLIGHSWGGAMLASAYLGQHPDRVDRAILIEQGYLNAKGKAAWETRSAQYMSGAGYGLQALLNGFDAANVAGSDDQASDDFLIGQMGGSVKLSWSNQLRQADKLLEMA
jgi:proline iminopeptidase